jgi:hypothetical protein
MPLAVIATLATLATLAALVFSCSGGGSSPDGGGGSGGGGGGNTGGSGGGTVFSCQDIRLCALDYADDTAVMTNCKSKGSADAQAAFQALYDCTKNTGGCDPVNDINCLCMAQCLQDPPCENLVFTCIGSAADALCGGPCGG